jgi:hypothetical protein
MTSPGPRRDGRSLPSTVPTTRYEIEVTDDQVILHGSGWGHGVGMGQYGAMGKAERGMTHDDILATYYNGLRPTVDDRLPDRIRVGLADQLDELVMHADGPFQVRVGGQVITDRGLGTWTIQAAADRTMRLVAPPGYGAPLVVDPTATPRQHPFTVETVPLETVVNKPAELTLEVQAAGEPVGTLALGVVDPGRHTVAWRLDTDDGPLPPGTYDVQLVAIDEDAERAGAPVQVTIGQAGSGASHRDRAGRPCPPRSRLRPRPSPRCCSPVRPDCWAVRCSVGGGRTDEPRAPAALSRSTPHAATTAGRR